MPFAAGRNGAIVLTNAQAEAGATVEVENWEVNREVVEDEVTNSASGIEEDFLPIRERWNVSCDLPLNSAQILESTLGLSNGTSVVDNAPAGNCAFIGYIGDVQGVAVRTLGYRGVVRITKISAVVNSRKASRIRLEARGLSILRPPGVASADTATSYTVTPP